MKLLLLCLMLPVLLATQAIADTNQLQVAADIRSKIDAARTALQSATSDSDKKAKSAEIVKLYFAFSTALATAKGALEQEKAKPEAASPYLQSAVDLQLKNIDDQLATAADEIQNGSFQKAPQNTDPKFPAAAQDFKQQLAGALKASESVSDRVSLVLGLGSLVTAGESDYQLQSNILTAKTLGHATPQLLTGLAFRTWVPNFRIFCGEERKSENFVVKQSKIAKDKAKSAKNNEAIDRANAAIDEAKAEAHGAYESCMTKRDLWQRNPFNAFVSLKFAPGTSEPINGYVIGGSYSLHSHLDVLIGYALTPVNEPAPGFISTAVQAVRNGQPKGLYTAFDANAMAMNAKNAFDGFPLTNPTTNALIYSGNPLATHYRGGAVFGVSFPFSFGSFLKPAPAAKSPETPPGTAAQ